MNASIQNLSLQRYLRVVLNILTLSMVSICAWGQISVGLEPGAPISFDAQPSPAEWTTLSVSPGEGPAVTTVAGLTGVVQSYAASSIATEIPVVSEPAPAANGVAVWSSAARKVFTRPTGNTATLVMAKVTNGSGYALEQVVISYALGVAQPASEEVPSYHLFFSTNGAAGSWTRVPALSGIASASVLRSVVTVGHWPHGTPLFVLWADDNATLSDTSYSIDDVSIAVPPLEFISGFGDQLVPPGGNATLSVTAGGIPPLRYEWRKDGGTIPGATNAVLMLTNVSLGDAGVYSVVVSDVRGAITNSATVTVGCAIPQFTSMSPPQTLYPGGNLSLNVNVTGTAPIVYQWYRDNVAIPGATNATFVRTNVTTSDTGLYRVQATNCGGNSSSSNVLVAVIARPQAVIGLTNTIWRYDQSGTDLGTAWREVDYDDSSWPAGRGVLGRETAAAVASLIHTPLNLTDTAGQSVITYYFRSEFVVTNDLRDISLVVSNLFDDGQVVYVNGVEAYRMNMPPGNIHHATFAPGVTTEGVFWRTNVASELLVRGTNFIAVEVHQANIGSSDIVMGLHAEVVEAVPTALTIVDHPRDVTVSEARSFTLGADVSGGRPTYQWFKDGVAIPGATERIFTVTNAAFSDAGLYAVFVSNAVTRVMSRLAAVSVLADTEAPRLLAADLVGPTEVLLTFSEPIAADTVLPMSFRLLLPSGAETSFVSVTLVNSTNVLLTVAAPLGEDGYGVAVSGVADASPSRLMVPDGSRVPIGQSVRLVAPDAFWTFYDPYPPIGEPVEAPDGWNSSETAPSHWGEAPGGFFSGVFSDMPATPANTTLSASPAITAYFRKEFDLQMSRAGLRITGEIFFNDGAVIYLNGNEIARFNVPAGTTHEVAATAPAQGVLSNRFVLPTSMLKAGRNVIAVEIRQAMPGDLTKAFAMSVDARFESRLGSPLRMFGGPESASVLEGRTVTFAISATGAEFFQWRINGVEVPGATGATLEIAPALELDGASVSVEVTGGGTSMISSNAVLRVIPDLSPPQLVSASSSNSTVLVRFSEPISAATAADPGNFSIINGTGEENIVLSTTLDGGSNVVLQTTSPVLIGSILRAQNVRDTSMAGNVVPSNSATVIGVVSMAMPMNAVWQYDESGLEIGTAWRERVFDTAGWKTGQALFYAHRTTDGALPFPIQTRLKLTDDITGTQIPSYYFRTTLDLPYAISAKLLCRFVVDDGIVFYLNGSELFRAGMPGGTVTRSTPANRTAGTDLAVESELIEIPVSFVAGSNVIAASVHQVNFTSPDVAFAAEITLLSDSVLLTPAERAPILMRRWGGAFALEWSGTNGLQSAKSVNGPWSTIASAPPFFASPTGAMMFYRSGP